jgi:hypothetical protein
MRKIESAMMDAIREKKPFKCANTEVIPTVFEHSERKIDRVNVYLHGNHIAQITPDCVDICDCGWQTPTTKSRLNVILHELCGAGIYQKNHTWFGTAIEEDDWEIEKNSRHCFVRG